ncbi:EamA family transporter RarD [Castellaniella sp. S9]|uniref:EamA family transporter RarD n=1 Tax=Castellaniella sp. S9 TaxID=2993652 RepID=UPI0022B4FC45|nr:EamA family transporter RarD [Castellaniella sp. S9]
MKQGVALSVGASALFAGLYYYATLMRPFDGDIIFAWRVLLGLPALAVVVQRARGWTEIRAVGRRLSEPGFLALTFVSAALLGVQLWLFVWAPLHGMGLDVAMGYFLLPLMMVVVGRLFYGERLSRGQAWAVGLAALGVAHELWRVGAVSWATAVVILGYPPYFMLRRRLKVGSLASLWYDMLLLLPPALLILQMQSHEAARAFVEFPRLFLLVPLLGLISSVALAMYLAASRMLPLSLFGLLSYVEPVLLFWVAFLLLGEPVGITEWLTYIPIWLAVLLVALEGAKKWRAEARRSS